jgi:hypothetical protein
MAYPVTHFEIIGKDNKKLRDFYCGVREAHTPSR